MQPDAATAAPGRPLAEPPWLAELVQGQACSSSALARVCWGPTRLICTQFRALQASASWKKSILGLSFPETRCQECRCGASGDTLGYCRGTGAGNTWQASSFRSVSFSSSPLHPAINGLVTALNPKWIIHSWHKQCMIYILSATFTKSLYTPESHDAAFWLVWVLQ